MIIDSHLHYGNQGIFKLDFELLQNQMDINGISMGIISTINCCEFRSDSNELMEIQFPQIGANKALLYELQHCRKKFYISFWCKPYQEQNISEVFEFIRDNRQIIKGLKFHPFYSRLPLDDSRYDAYVDMAEQLNIPISVHTANDRLSNPVQMLAMAKRFPRVLFVMVHMGLCSDNELAVECLSQADNLYGDTTWVPFEKVKKACSVCGYDKMIFGSDAPIDGIKSYAFYKPLLDAYHENPAQWECVMYKNSMRIFNINR